jgi:hypothetical protein
VANPKEAKIVQSLLRNNIQIYLFKILYSPKDIFSKSRLKVTDVHVANDVNK